MIVIKFVKYCYEQLQMFLVFFSCLFHQLMWLQYDLIIASYRIRSLKLSINFQSQYQMLSVQQNIHFRKEFTTLNYIMQAEHQSKIYEAIIIGAGPAGLGAASFFEKEKLPYLVLEGRLRVGGRVHSQQIDDVKMDLGACWIHSFKKNVNPMSKYVRKFDVQTCCLTKRTIGRKFIDGEEFKEFSEQVMEDSRFIHHQFFAVAEKNQADTQEDISLYQGAQQVFKKRWEKLSPVERRCTQVLINMTEHYEASSTKQLSTRHYEFRKDSGADLFPSGGYAGLMRKISTDLNILLNKKVVKILRQKQKVTVVCSDGSIYLSKKILVSLPLGVLKAGTVEITPQLPEKHQLAIKRLGVGLMNKIIMSFTQNFWGPVYWLSIGCDERGKFPQFYNFSQNGKNILCCFITDDFARKCEGRSDNQVVKDLVDLLKNIYNKCNVQLREAVVTHWGSDEFSLGSYTSFHVGSSPEDCYNLRKAVDDQLWIIGEHCYAEHIGTAHGAMQTGQWAASQVLKSLKWINPKEKVKPIHKN